MRRAFCPPSIFTEYSTHCLVILHCCTVSQSVSYIWGFVTRSVTCLMYGALIIPFLECTQPLGLGSIASDESYTQNSPGSQQQQQQRRRKSHATYLRRSCSHKTLDFIKYCSPTWKTCRKRALHEYHDLLFGREVGVENRYSRRQRCHRVSQ